MEKEVKEASLPTANVCLSPTNLSVDPYYLAHHKAESFLREENVHGKLNFGRVYWGDGEVRACGLKFNHALGMHAPGEGRGWAEFKIPEGARYFHTIFGQADAGGSNASNTGIGRVFVDGYKLWEGVAGGDAPYVVQLKPLAVPEFSRVLRLEVEIKTTQHSCHTTWLNPYFSANNVEML